MKVEEDLGVKVTYEIWRRHALREDSDTQVAGMMTASQSLKHLRACRRDVADLNTVFRFYRVRVTSHRERVS